jgi:hypothetical protein
LPPKDGYLMPKRDNLKFPGRRGYEHGAASVTLAMPSPRSSRYLFTILIVDTPADLLPVLGGLHHIIAESDFG